MSTTDVLSPLHATGLTHAYGDRTVLDGIDLVAAEGSQVRGPPRPLRFDSRLTDARGGAVTVRELRVAGRLLVDRLDVPAGGRLLVTGPNGSGKSTLLAVLAGLLAPDHGNVTGRVPPGRPAPAGGPLRAAAVKRRGDMDCGRGTPPGRDAR